MLFLFLLFLTFSISGSTSSSSSLSNLITFDQQQQQQQRSPCIEIEEVVPGAAQSVMHSFLHLQVLQGCIQYRKKYPCKENEILALNTISDIFSIFNDPIGDLSASKPLIASFFSNFTFYAFRDSPSDFIKLFSYCLLSIFSQKNIPLFHLFGITFPFMVGEPNPPIISSSLEESFAEFVACSDDLSMLDAPYIASIAGRIAFFAGIPDFMKRVTRHCGSDGKVYITIRVPFNTGLWITVNFENLTVKKICSIDLKSAKKITFPTCSDENSGGGDNAIRMEYILNSIIFKRKKIIQNTFYYYAVVRLSEGKWMLWGADDGLYLQRPVEMSEEEVFSMPLIGSNFYIVNAIWVREDFIGF